MPGLLAMQPITQVNSAFYPELDSKISISFLHKSSTWQRWIWTLYTAA